MKNLNSLLFVAFVAISFLFGCGGIQKTSEETKIAEPDKVFDGRGYTVKYPSQLVTLKGTADNGDPLFESKEIEFLIYLDGRETLRIDEFENLSKEAILKKAFEEDLKMEAVVISEKKLEKDSYTIVWSNPEMADKVHIQKVIFADNLLTRLDITHNKNAKAEIRTSINEIVKSFN